MTLAPLRLGPDPDDLVRCVSCGLCLPHCPTYRLTGEEEASPRGRITAMRAVADGSAPLDADYAGVLDFCLACRACETACPSDVPFGRLMEDARAEVHVQLPAPPWRRVVDALAFRFLVPNRVAMRIGAALLAAAQRLVALERLAPPRLRVAARGVPRLPLAVGRARAGAPPVGTGTRPERVALFTGCVGEAVFPAVNDRTAALLAAAGYRVEFPSDQTCCGALHAHAGREADARRLARRNVGALEGFDMVVVNAAGCGAHLRTLPHVLRGEGAWSVRAAGVSDRVRDILDVLAALPEKPYLATGAGRVAVHDACHHQHAQRLREQPRHVLAAAGYEPVTPTLSERCCGAAGLYQATHPETAARLGAEKAAALAATGATVVAAANPGCVMQLAAHLPAGITVVHPVELLVPDPGPAP